MTPKKSYTIKVEPATTPDGRPGFRVECSCATHPDGKSAAIVLDHSATTGRAYPESHVHGVVLQAHHPVLGPRLIGRGIWAVVMEK